MPAKYRQIADNLMRRIRDGEIGDGRRLPGENVLAETYEVSRSTIRQALAELQQAGNDRDLDGSRLLRSL
jgi:GntR family transcriptional regulator